MTPTARCVGNPGLSGVTPEERQLSGAADSPSQTPLLEGVFERYRDQRLHREKLLLIIFFFLLVRIYLPACPLEPRKLDKHYRSSSRTSPPRGDKVDKGEGIAVYLLRSHGFHSESYSDADFN